MLEFSYIQICSVIFSVLCFTLFILLYFQSRLKQPLLFMTAPEYSMTQQRKWRAVEDVFVASVVVERERHGPQKSW